MRKEVDIHKVIDLVLAAAHESSEAAGMNGSWSDGGASILKTQVEYYRYGMRGDIPPYWQKYADQAQAMSDPEYDTYQRLKEKFKDR